MLRTGEEVIAIRNACIQDYTTSINPDGVTEESLELTTQQSILHSIGNSVNNTLTTKAAF